MSHPHPPQVPQSMSDSWFYTSFGSDPQGPFARKQIEEFIRAKKILPDSSMIAGPDGQWRTLGETELYQTTLAQAAEAEAATRAGQSFYTPPSTSAVVEPQTDSSYGGIGRLAFWAINISACIFYYLGIVVLLAGFIFGSASASSIFDDAGILLWGGLIAITLISVATVIWANLSRLTNLSMSRWNILWHLVPFFSFWITWRLSCCPPGYAFHKELDLPAKIMTWMILLPFLALFGLSAYQAVFTLR